MGLASLHKFTYLPVVGLILGGTLFLYTLLSIGLLYFAIKKKIHRQLLNKYMSVQNLVVLWQVVHLVVILYLRNQSGVETIVLSVLTRYQLLLLV